MSVKMLRAQLIDRRISPAGMVEKCEMRQRLKRAACFDAPGLIYPSSIFTSSPLNRQTQEIREVQSAPSDSNFCEGAAATVAQGPETKSGVESRPMTTTTTMEIPEDEAKLAMKRVFVACLQAER